MSVAFPPAGRAECGRPFSYDRNGVLEVEATLVATRRKFTLVIAKHAKGLTEEQVRRAVRDMAKLKAHPREDAVNRFLLARAERVYKELPAELRRMLGGLLDGFEAALESRDPEAIGRHRQELEIFLSLHDPSGDDPTGNEE
jgi:molecular chaperone HscC